MAGRLIAVVGPSGVGKDTVMDALAAARPELALVRRAITRPEAAGGEEFEGITEDEFARRRDAGAFALHWPAHGLHYGVPASVEAQLAAGQDLLVNLSRSVLAEANARFPDFVVLSLTAPPAVLAERLAGRGRESAAEIAKRLNRADFALPPGLPVITVANDGDLCDTVRRALTALYPQTEAARD